VESRTVWIEASAFSGPPILPTGHHLTELNSYSSPRNVEAPTDDRFKAYSRLRNPETPDEAQFRGIHDLMRTRPGVNSHNQ
jgi:hypothetical protein